MRSFLKAFDAVVPTVRWGTVSCVQIAETERVSVNICWTSPLKRDFHSNVYSEEGISSSTNKAEIENQTLVCMEIDSQGTFGTLMIYTFIDLISLMLLLSYADSSVVEWPKELLLNPQWPMVHSLTTDTALITELLLLSISLFILIVWFVAPVGFCPHESPSSLINVLWFQMSLVPFRSVAKSVGDHSVMTFVMKLMPLMEPMHSHRDEHSGMGWYLKSKDESSSNSEIRLWLQCWKVISEGEGHSILTQ